MSQFRQKDNDIEEKQKHYFDQHHRVKQLPELSQGQTVWIPDRKENGEVVDKHMTQPSYVVKLQQLQCVEIADILFHRRHQSRETV